MESQLIQIDSYDFVVNFNSFLKFIIDKEFTIKISEKKDKDITLDSKIHFTIGIKGKDPILLKKFLNFLKGIKELNEKEKDEKSGLFLKYLALERNYNLLVINYLEKKIDYKIDEKLLEQFELNEILEDKKISLNFLNKVLDSLSNLYLLLLNGNNYKENEKLIKESIKEKEGDIYLVIHSFNKNNKKEILNHFNDNIRYRKNQIINKNFEKTENDEICYYYIENNKEIVHFFFDEDNYTIKDNKDLWNIIKSKIIIEHQKKNFYEDYKNLFEKYLSLMFENIKLNNDINGVIKLESIPKKKIISSNLILIQEPKLTYSYQIVYNKIKFYFETDTKVKSIKANFTQGNLCNLLKLDTVIFKQNDSDNNNLIFTNKEMNDIKDITIKISHNECIICTGPIKKNSNKIKCQKGILYFEYDITQHLNKPHHSLNISYKDNII